MPFHSFFSEQPLKPFLLMMLSFKVCERSLNVSGGGPSAATAHQFVRAEMLPSGYLIRPFDGGGSIVHIVDHLDLEAWSVPEVLRPLYESSRVVAQKMTTAVQPVFTFANQVGLDMLEITLVALQDITLDKIFDEPGRKALCSDFAELMEQEWAVKFPMSRLLCGKSWVKTTMCTVWSSPLLTGHLFKLPSSSLSLHQNEKRKTLAIFVIKRFRKLKCLFCCSVRF